jgi:hypothetical protein
VHLLVKRQTGQQHFNTSSETVFTTLAIRWNAVDDLDLADGSLHLHVGAVITSLRGWQFAMSATPGFFSFFYDGLDLHVICLCS